MPHTEELYCDDWVGVEVGLVVALGLDRAVVSRLLVGTTRA